MVVKPYRTPLCRDCGKQLGKRKGHGYCARCVNRHRCNVCCEVYQPHDMASASLCLNCQVLVNWMAEAHADRNYNQNTPDPPGWEAHIERLAARAAAGTPLFPKNPLSLGKAS